MEKKDIIIRDVQMLYELNRELADIHSKMIGNSIELATHSISKLQYILSDMTGLSDYEMNSKVESWQAERAVLREESTALDPSALIGCIASLREYVNVCNSFPYNVQDDVNLEPLSRLGNILSNLAWIIIQREAIDLPLTLVSAAMSIPKHRAAAKKSMSRKATDAKYSPGRDLYREALTVAQRMWEEGSTLKHHEMKQFLIKEYQNENGKLIFAKFDPHCGYTEHGLLKQLKTLAINMNRPDLISGKKL